MKSPVNNPITIFPVIRIMEKTVKKEDNHVTFKAVDDATHMVYIFNAFDAMADRIGRMTMKGRCSITSELRAYLDSQNIIRYSFNVLSIRFVDGSDMNFYSSKDYNNKKPVSEKPTPKPFPETKPETKSDNAPVEEEQEEGQIDMEAFQAFLNA